MKNLFLLTFLAVGLLIVNPSTASATIFTENFSTVTAWTAAEGATFTTDGAVATLADAADGTGVTTRDAAPRISYENGDIASLVITAVNATAGTYWHLSAHQFDGGGAYLGELELLPWSNSTGTFTSNFTGKSASLVAWVPALRISSPTPGTNGSASFDTLSVSGTAPVPEPASLLLLGSGLIGLIGISRKRK